MGGRSGGSQTVTQKQEIDPVLRAHLYGGAIPSEYMTGIVPAYFQPGGTLAGQAGNVAALYGPSFYREPEPEKPASAAGREDRDGGGADNRDGFSRNDPGAPLDATDGRAWGGGGADNRDGPSGGYGSSEPGAGGLYNDGGIVSLYQEGGPVTGGSSFARAIRRVAQMRRDRDAAAASAANTTPLEAVDPRTPAYADRFNLPPEDERGDYEPLSLAEQVYQLTVGTDLGSMLPEYEVAERTGMQRQAEELARAGVGAYEPYLASGAATIGGGIGATGRGLGMTEDFASQISGITGEGQAALRQAARQATAAAQRGERAAGRAAEETYRAAEEALPFREEGLAAIREGRAMLGGAAQLYDPMAYRGYMDPFTEEVIRQSERDIARMGDIERQRIGAGAVQAGAFGGSRQAVAEQELARNLAEQQARTSAALRSQGYQTAQQQAQQAFEQQQQRQLTTGQSFGQLGTQTGALGTSFGQLGVGAAGQAGQLGLGAGQLGLQGAQTAGQMGLQGAQLGLQGVQTGLGAAAQMGQLGQGLGSLGGQMIGAGGQAQQMGLQDVNTMLTVGAQQQAQRQAELDAQRMSQFQRVMAPYQQTAFRADVLSGSPTGIVSTFTQPGPSPISQLAGLGVGAYGLSQAFR